MTAAIESLVMAVQFLTRLPVPPTSHLSGEVAAIRLRQSLVWFPLVGGMVSAITAGVIIGAEQLWPRLVAVVLALIIEARLTGAFHEDAVADFCDAMGGGLSRDDKLRIFKDSRIGSYGALGLLLAVGLRAALLVSLPAPILAAALIASGAIGRWTVLVVIAHVAPIGHRDGLAKDIAGRLGKRGAGLGLALGAPALLWVAMLAPGRLLAALLICGLFAILFARHLERVLGGSTGDCLGFAAYAGGLLALLVFVALPV